MASELPTSHTYPPSPSGVQRIITEALEFLERDNKYAIRVLETEVEATMHVVGTVNALIAVVSDH
jgi:hypothetical protein